MLTLSLNETTCCPSSVLLPIVLLAEPASEITSWLIDGSPEQYVCLYQPLNAPDDDESGPPTA